MIRSLICITLFCAATTVSAQGESPAVDTRTGTPAAPASAAPTEGTVIIGDRESPIGLYIMPWRNSIAQTDMDRPARLLQTDLSPIDEAVFVRQLEYQRTLSGALDRRNQVTPDVPLPATGGGE